MENSSLNDIINWLQDSPLLSLLFVFFAALFESLAIVGLIMPGAIIMVLFGALIAMDIVPFWPVMLSAIFGAILGDSLSYWLGYHYKDSLRLHWPFSRYPIMLDRGIVFFERHGGKSVALGRFVGPLRAVIPLVAGMLDMPRSRFLFTNIISAIAWAPLYLLPGYLFGLSLEVASEFASRFLILFFILILTSWLVLFILRQIYLWLVPYLEYLLWRLVMWSHHHPIAGKIPTAVASPAHPEIRGLSLMTLILLLTSSVFILIYQAIAHLSFIDNLDKVIGNGFLALHNPPFNKLMAAFASLSDINLVFYVVSLSLIWLIWQRYWFAIAHISAAILFPLLTTLLPDINSHDEISSLVNTTTQQHDTQLILAFSIYGFLTIILAREIRASWRRIIYFVCTILIMMISISHLYMKWELFSHITGQIALSLLWLMIIGIAYRRHIQPDTHSPHILPIIMLLPVVMVVYAGIYYEQYLPHTSIKNNNYVMSKTAWIESGWASFPAYRDDLRRKSDFPINIQWADDLAKIKNKFTALGWKEPQSEFKLYFQWLNTSASVVQLPVLSHLHNGHYELLHMVKYNNSEDKVMILRLWHSNVLIQNDTAEIPVWIGTMSMLVPTKYYGLRFLKTDSNFPDTRKILNHISGVKFESRLRQRGNKTENKATEIILVY